MLQSEEFINVCKNRIWNHYVDTISYVRYDDIYLVWYCKTIQNHKALFYPKGSSKYIECTYNGDNDEIYFDIYEKEDKIIVKLNN